MVNFGQAAVGIILLLIVVGGLLYLFYSRINAVEKTGYGALIMLALISLMIPVFWIMEGGNQASAQQQLHTSAVERGMKLYAQYCTNKCYAIKNDKIVDPKYNGYAINDLNQLSDNDLTRIVSAGVYNPKAPAPANLSAVPRSEEYGGALLSNDIDYLDAFIRSASPSYLKLHGYPSHANGFNDLPAYLKANNTTQYQAGVSLGSFGQFGQPTDQTKNNAVTIDIVDPGQEGAACGSQTACFTPINVSVKVGTVITWINKSKVGHTVVAIQGNNTASPKAAKQIFDSTAEIPLIPTNGTFKYTVTADAFNANAADHTLFYYCSVHPDMLAELTIVQ